MLREALDALDAGVVVFDAALRYRFGNRIYHESFPHLPDDAALAGMPYAEVLGLTIDAGAIADPQAYTDRAGFIARRVREVADRTPAPRPVRSVDGLRTYDVHAKWLPSGNRMSMRVETTHTAQLQRELLRSQRLDAIARLSGEVAHDFNNLLTVILGNLDLLTAQLGSLPPAMAGRLAPLATAALEAAEAGARRTAELLTYARPLGGQPTRIDPGARIAAMAKLLRRDIAGRATLRLAVRQGVGEIECAPAQFEAALINLVVNAAEAIARRPPGAPPGRIEIAGRSEADRFVLRVTDNGSGMPPSLAAHAHEPFVTTKPAGEGPGLGLVQVQLFAETGGGDMAIASTPDSGTTVTLRLPLARTQPAAAPPSAAAAAGIRILVVEDDAAVLATLCQVLSGFGYSLLTARDADQALALLDGAPDLALLFSDIVMPASRLDGVQLARAAMARRPGLKVLLTSGYPAETLRDGLPPGIAVLAKPYRREELAVRLYALAGRPDPAGG